MKPIKRQPSMDILSIIDGLISIIFFNGENFEQAALNKEIYVGLLHNTMLHKCSFLGLVAVSSGI